MTPETQRHDRGIRRVLTAFEKDPGDALVGEWPLRDISLAKLQELFSRPPEDPMYDGYVFGPRQAVVLQRHVAHEIAFEKLDYFVEAYREPGGPPEAPPRDLPTEIFGSTSQAKPRTPVERLLEGENRDDR